MNSKPTTNPFRIVTCTFSSNLSQNSCIWQLLQLTWSAQRIEQCIWSSQRSEFDFWASSNFFRFLFNHLGCSFYCKDHFHFHVFICGSKYDSFHMIQFTNVTSYQNCSFVRSTHGPINNCDHLSKTKFVVNVQQSKQKWSWVLTVCPCFTVSLIKSSSKLARNVSLGCSMRGTTNSKIRATLWITR